MPDTENTKWLAICYTLGALPSRNRVFVWRKLKEIGAVYFQQSVAVLPSSDYLLHYLEELREKILQFGGEASIVSMNFLNAADENAVTARFNENIKSDYHEIEKLILALVDEIESIHSKGEMTQERLLDELSALNRSRKAFEKILLRDHFKTKYHEKVEHMIQTSLDRINYFLLEHRSGNAML